MLQVTALTVKLRRKMHDIIDQLRAAGFRGELDDSTEAREFYSHDASLFEIRPELIAMPLDSFDVQKLVAFVKKHKKDNKDLSLTARSAGTDMAGGAINESIIVDFNKHFTKVESVSATETRTQPGVFYRDFEKKTLEHNALMPTYPASRDLCTVGGMVANNSGGEKSLEFGKTKDYIVQLRVVFSDGKEYVVKPLNKRELDAKIAQNDFEGNIYKQIYELCETHYDEIKAAAPQVSKNSMGYTLWEVWDRETGIFDLTKLIVGSEGTLGFVTDITYRLVPARPHSGLLVLFMKNINQLGEVIPKVLEHKPATFESFDDATLWLSIRFMPSFLKMLGTVRFIRLLISLIPDGLQLLRGVPKLILMIEFNGQTEEEVRQKIRNLHHDLRAKRARYEINGFEETPTEGSSEKFWVMRRQSFQLLRSKVKDKHTAPFIDDLIVQPQYLTEFLPRLQKIVKKYKLFATIAGHMGDGNFHIIPLMKLEDPRERAKLLPAMKEVNNLVLKYHGSLSGEHNDGLVRGPWLEQQFGKEIVGLFREVKHIFDPDNMFNPHKKADADWDYSFSHIRDHF
ncbi:MAG TPA: FAD-binding oxidoreductase [Candidatus Saccharimonadales bacterium]|nr:FAD-binding oxidoreductase [Candidatus Saccharimonadales bacterium]